MGPPTAEELHERRMKVYQLRRGGMGVVNIGQAVGVSQATVSKDMAWLRSKGYELGGTDLQIYEHARDRARTTSASDPGRIAELRHQIIAMRIEGHAPRDIARTLGLALVTVQNHIAAVYNSLTAPKAEESRQIELDRLDDLLLHLRSGIKAGDPKSIGVAAKISAQRAHLAGWNKPIQIENTNITVDAIDLELARLAARLDQVSGPRGADIDGEVVNLDTRR